MTGGRGGSKGRHWHESWNKFQYIETYYHETGFGSSARTGQRKKAGFGEKKVEFRNSGLDKSRLSG